MAHNNAHIRIVPEPDQKSVQDADYTHRCFQFVGESSLQMKMLMSLLSGKFRKPASLTSLKDLDINAVNEASDTLVVLDCLSLHKDELIYLMETLDPDRAPGIVLINADENTGTQKLASWSHITGIFQHNAEPEQVLSGFDHLLKGGLWLPRNVMETLLLNGGRQAITRRNKPMPVKLTRRENEILEKLADGTSNTRIADSLFLSEHTVKTHLYNIYKKVKVSNRTQACNWLKQYRGE